MGAQDAGEGREVVDLVLTFMDRRQVWKTQPEAYAAAIRRLQQVVVPHCRYQSVRSLYSAERAGRTSCGNFCYDLLHLQGERAFEQAEKGVA